MPKRKQKKGTDALPGVVREYWEKKCTRLTPDCIKILGEVINDFIEHSWDMHRKAEHPQPDYIAKQNIDRAFGQVRDTLTDEIAHQLGHYAYREQIARRRYWFSEATANEIAYALVNALLEEYTGRDVIESIMAQTGLSIVTIRHFLYELSHVIPEYRELARIARQMEREMLGR